MPQQHPRSPPAPPQPARRRLPAGRRLEVILAEAAAFFADEGFAGTTRQLAARLGVTQALLYRHFRSKEALIEATLAHALRTGWEPGWDDLIRDRRLPLEERLARFYAAYQGRSTATSLRLFMRLALDAGTVARRYSVPLTERVLRPVIDELRHEGGLPPSDAVPLLRGERELAMMLHASVVFLGIRKHVYRMPMPDDLGDVIGLYTATFVAGARAQVARLHAPGAPATMTVELLDRRGRPSPAVSSRRARRGSSRS